MKRFLIPLAIGAIAWSMSATISPEDQRRYLVNKVRDDQQTRDIFLSMGDDEIRTVYSFMKNFVEKGRQLTPGNPLYQKVEIISNRYGIFK